MAPVEPVEPVETVEPGVVRLRSSVEISPLDPARERALLAAFDAHWSHSEAEVSHGSWRAALGLAGLTLAINWMVMATPPRTVPVPAETAIETETAFVAWPGAEARPRFESGSVVRIDLPVSALPALGLAAPPSAGDVVSAEVIVGQDGFARAVRLVQ
jgi:hypothetical protein